MSNRLVVIVSDPPLDGQVPVWNNSQQQFINTTPSSGGWTTSFDLDFTTEGSQDLNVANNYTIGGLSWKAEPNTFGRGDTQIVNGSGLVIQCINGGSGYGGVVGNSNVKNAPLLWLPLTQLGLTQLDYTTAFRIWVYVSNQTMGSNSSSTGMFFGIDNDITQGSSGTTWFSMVGARSQVSSTQTQLRSDIMFASASDVGGGSANITGSSSWTAGISTSRVDIPSLIPGLDGGSTIATSYGPAYSGSWPVQIPWTISNASSFTSGTSGPIGFVNPNGTPIGDTLGIVVGCANTDAFTLPSTTTIARMRVDYKY